MSLFEAPLFPLMWNWNWYFIVNIVAKCRRISHKCVNAKWIAGLYIWGQGIDKGIVEYGWGVNYILYCGRGTGDKCWWTLRPGWHMFKLDKHEFIKLVHHATSLSNLLKSLRVVVINQGWTYMSFQSSKGKGTGRIYMYLCCNIIVASLWCHLEHHELGGAKKKVTLLLEEHVLLKYGE